jgi:hypothetical protein
MLAVRCSGSTDDTTAASISDGYVEHLPSGDVDSQQQPQSGHTNTTAIYPSSLPKIEVTVVEHLAVSCLS